MRVRVGVVAGIEALYRENDLRDLLVTDLESRLEQLEQLDPDVLSEKSLRDWAAWVNQVERKLQSAEQVMQSCHKFLTQRNLAQLSAIAPRNDERKEFVRFVASLPR
jgi:hypothetical protein